MASINSRLDKRDKAILQYIKDHDGPNENQIVNALHEQKLSSKRTTLKKIKELKQKGEIIDSLKEGESGFHHYSINKDKSQFNRINEELLAIEALFDPLEKYIKMIEQAHKRFGFDKAKDERYFIFIAAYFESLTLLLITILDWTRKVIRSEKDAQILNGKNTDLLLRLFKISPIKKLHSKLHESMFSIMREERPSFQKIDEIKSKIAEYEKQTPVPKGRIKEQIKLMENELKLIDNQVKSRDSHIHILELQNELRENLIEKLNNAVHGIK